VTLFAPPFVLTHASAINSRHSRLGELRLVGRTDVDFGVPQVGVPEDRLDLHRGTPGFRQTTTDQLSLPNRRMPC
jgi:hypothetical protein